MSEAIYNAIMAELAETNAMMEEAIEEAKQALDDVSEYRPDSFQVRNRNRR